MISNEEQHKLNFENSNELDIEIQSVHNTMYLRVVELRLPNIYIHYCTLFTNELMRSKLYKIQCHEITVTITQLKCRC